jgi:hypothetical protein
MADPKAPRGLEGTNRPGKLPPLHGTTLRSLRIWLNLRYSRGCSDSLASQEDPRAGRVGPVDSTSGL